MRIATGLALSAALALGACVPDHRFDREGSPDGGDVQRLDGQGDTGIDAGCMTPTTVQITIPSASTVHTSHGVSVQATITGCTPDRVDVEVGGRVVASNVPPPYQYMFDTSMMAEGVYDLVIVAIVNGGRIMSSTLMIVVDHTAPMVTMHTPATDAGGVAYHAPVTITFSEPIDPTSVSPSALSITAQTPPGTNVAYTPMWNADNTVLTLTLGPAPMIPNNLTANLMPNIHDLAGNALSVMPWQWNVPVWAPLGSGIMGTSTQAGTAAVLRLRADGTPVVVYDEGSASGDHIRLMTWSGSAWTPLGPPESVASPARIVDLAAVLDSSGNPYVVWVEGTGTVGGLVYAAHFDGTAWTVLGGGALNYHSGTQALSPSVALDSMGNLFAAWSETALLAIIPTTRRWDGTSWTDVGSGQIIQPSGMTFADMPEIAVDPTGNVYVASLWKANTSGAQYHLYLHEALTGSAAWNMLGTGAADPASAVDEHISMLIDFVSHVHIGWTRINSSGGTEIDHTVWTGASFVSDGFPHAHGTGSAAQAHTPWMRLDLTNEPSLAWTEAGALYVTVFTGGAWNTYAPPVTDSGMQPVNRLTGEYDRYGETVFAWTRSDPVGAGTFNILVNLANR